MGSMGSSTTTSAPPGYMSDYMKDVLGQATKMMNKGVGSYNGSMVTPFSKQTKYGMKSLMDLSEGAQKGAYGDFFNGVMDNGGLTQGQSTVNSNMRSMADSGLMNELINNGSGLTGSQQRALGTSEAAGNKIGAYADLIAGNGGLTGDQQTAMDRWRGQTSSPFSTDAPGYSTVRENAMEDQRAALAAQSAASGRYGAGMDQAILAREQGRLGGQMDYNEYLRWQNQGDQAANNMFQGGQQATANIPSLYGATQDAAGKTSGIAQMGVNNNLAALSQKAALEGQMFNQEQARFGNMTGSYDAMMKPAQSAMLVGGMNEDLYSRMLQDRMRMAQQPLTTLSQYTGFGGMPVGQTQTSQMSPLQMGIGGLLGLSAFI